MQVLNPCETILSDPIQINGIKVVDDYSEVSMQHLMALDRRTINLWGEATGKTMAFRMKKVCMYNVSTRSIYVFILFLRPEKILYKANLGWKPSGRPKKGFFL